MIFLLKYWKYIGAFAGLLIVVLAVMSVTNAYRQAAKVPALEKQIIDTIAACNKDKETTRKVSYAYQTELSTLNSKLRAVRMRPAKCLPITKPATGYYDAASKGINAGQGIDSQWLIEFGGEAENYRLQVISLQDFINRERS